MKSIIKMFTISLLVTSLILVGCTTSLGDDTFQNPDGSTTVTKTYKKGTKTYTEETTTWPDGTVEEALYISDSKGNETGESKKTYPDGTVEQMNSEYVFKDKKETIDTTITKPNGTKTERHEEDQILGEDADNSERTFTANESTTFATGDPSGKTSETSESTGTMSMSNGHIVTETEKGTTSASYADGSKETVTFENKRDFREESSIYNDNSKTSTKTKPNGSKEIVTTKEQEFNIACRNPSEEAKAHSYNYYEVTTENKDPSGKTTSKKQIQKDFQNEESLVKLVTTTTNYTDGAATSIVVETLIPPLGKCLNDGLFMIETKDGTGKNVQKKEVEYVFYRGVKETDKLLMKMIFKNDGTNKTYNITYNRDTDPDHNPLWFLYNAYQAPQDDFTHTHKCMISGEKGYLTMFKYTKTLTETEKQDSPLGTFTITNQGLCSYEATPTAVTGETYTYDKNLDYSDLTFTTKF